MRTGDDTAAPKLETFSYPLGAAVQEELIGFLRTEWQGTDYNWVEAMSGNYGTELTIVSVIARQGGEVVATATVHFTRACPEVAILGNVLTHRAHRGRGLAGQVVEAALAQATAAGCAICLLGTATKPRNVYLQHGFEWQNGVVMNRKFGVPDFEQAYFSAGQPASIRAVTWGDLPGFTLLVTQPLASVCLDYPRRLISGRYTTLARCLSNFPVVWYDTAARGGQLLIVAEPKCGRIFGFGSVTRTSSVDRGNEATIEVVTHDNYTSSLQPLAERLVVCAHGAGVTQVSAFASVDDAQKLACFREMGFEERGKIANALKTSGASSDVLEFVKTIG